MIDCMWDNPGALPARGLDVATMISHYNYPKSDVAELVEKIRTVNNDGALVISKDGVLGLGGVSTYFGDMHSKKGMCKGSVNTSSWPESRKEKALVYCSSNNYCVAVPVICGNITKIVWHRNEPKLRAEFVVPPHHTVPVSSTFLLALLGLGVMTWVMREND